MDTHKVPLSSNITQSLLKFMSIESVMISNNLFLWHPFFLFPSIFPSIRVFYNELALCISWPKNWCFSISNSPSNEYSGLIFLTTGLISLLSEGLSRVFSRAAIQKQQFFNLEENNSSASAFYIIQLSHCT